MSSDRLKLRGILEAVENKIKDVLSESESAKCDSDACRKIQEICQSIKKDIKEAISLSENFDAEASDTIIVKFKDLSGLEKIGEGAFGYVFKAEHKGTPVAIKVQKTTDEPRKTTETKKEMEILRNLSHENVVTFRGVGHLLEDDVVDCPQLIAGQRYLVMEYIELNLEKYVQREKKSDVQNVLGLPPSTVWNLTKQITHGLQYLHGLDYAHRDLKPDNILIDTTALNMRVKLADFGLARGQEHIRGSSASVNYLRWMDPHLNSKSLGKKSIEDYKKGDVYSFAQVIAYMLTGKKPFSSITNVNDYLKQLSSASSSSMDSSENEDPVEIPSHIEKTPLDDLITQSRQRNLHQRPSFEDIAKKFFWKTENPYVSQSLRAEFFSCGFLKDTKIFVVDSLVSETYEGFIELNQIPKGYKQECVNNCLVNCPKTMKERHFLPTDLEEIKICEYKEKYRYYCAKADKKEIDDNKTVALKKLLLDREGDEEEQNIELSFSESSYCHHRAMRDVWKSFSEEEQGNIVQCKGDVNPSYSTSFGLHVAVLTNDKPKKFIFTKRSTRPGMASPGTYTCGIVESTSIKDYTYSDDKRGIRRISLVNTAVRGLLEELGIELTKDDAQAVCLTTTYLKFDNHEWGMCGFVDLTDERIEADHRLSVDKLKSRFTSGPKDKFEHERFEAVDFEIAPMVTFIRENYKKFASSTKLVAVKVMQAFFGTVAVEKAICAQM